MGGVPELHYLDDTGAEVQLTTGGTVNAGAENTVKDNIALNGFRIAVNGSLTQFAMIDGILDEFEDETAVDTGGSTNETYNATLDLYNNKGASEQAVAQGAGTAIGDMTENGGLAAAFDSTTSQTFVNSATKTGASGIVGKDWGAGVTKLIDKFKAYGPSTEGFFDSASPTDCVLKLEGSQNNSTWTMLFTSPNFTDSNGLSKTYTHAADTFVMTTSRLRKNSIFYFVCRSCCCSLFVDLFLREATDARRRPATGEHFQLHFPRGAGALGPSLAGDSGDGGPGAQSAVAAV